MYASEYRCRVVDKKWLTPSVVTIRFEPKKRIEYLPGQFLSLHVPVLAGAHGYVEGGEPQMVKRPYTFASSWQEGAKNGYEVCVKYLAGGKGGTYLKSLQVGDEIRLSAPYGDFTYRAPEEGRTFCFIGTGTGIAPFRAALQSELFTSDPPERGTLLFGARTPPEILYPAIFEDAGIQVVNAISKAKEEWPGFKGRVTDYLRSLPHDWDWDRRDFYLCGNSAMIAEVREILLNERAVSPLAIHQESF